MTKTTVAAILIATLGLAACAQDQAMTPSRIGGESSAPAAQAGANAGGVGAANNSTHSNGSGGGATGGTGGTAQ